MFKKSKPKLYNRIAQFLVLLVVSGAALFVFPSQSRAANLDAGTINFTSTATPNFFRVSADGFILSGDNVIADGNGASGGTTTTFSSTLTLTSPAQINATGRSSGDLLITTDTGPDTSSYIEGLVMIVMQQKDSKDPTFCSPWVAILNTFINCGNNGILQTPEGGSSRVLKIGEPVKFTFNITPDNRTTLGIANGSAAGTLYTLALLPTLQLASNTDPSYVKEVKTVGIQVFDTKANLEAHKGDPVPTEFASNNPVTTTGGIDQDNTTGTLLNFIASFIGSAISLFTTLIYWLFAFVIAPLIEAVLSIHPYKDVFVQVIYPGWLILRNLSNILFIIILLIIGLATLFQVERYNYKHLLVKVIIAAVMVNFSLVIGQSILGIADTVQNQFLPDRGNVVRSLGFELMVRPIQNMQSNLTDNSTSGGFSNLTYPFFLFALALGAFFSFVAILVFLVVRIVGLWILLMVSPVAYVARILPSTETYAEKWWSKFLAYAFITPIFAFFLNIAALFANSHVLSQGSGLYDSAAEAAIGSGVANFVYLTANHVTVLVFLLGGLAVAGSTGVYGAKTMTEFAKKGMSKPFSWGGKKIGEYANEKRLSTANKFQPKQGDGFFKTLGKSAMSSAIAPDVRIKARGERIKEHREKISGQAAANAADFSHSAYFGGIRTSKAEAFRLQQAKKAGDDLVNPENGYEVGKKMGEALKNGNLTPALGYAIKGLPNGVTNDVLDQLRKDGVITKAGNAGLEELLGKFDSLGVNELEKQALNVAFKAGARKSNNGFGDTVLAVDPATGKSAFLKRADLEKKEQEAVAKISPGTVASQVKPAALVTPKLDATGKAIKDPVTGKDEELPSKLLLEQMVNAIDNKNGHIKNGIADDVILNRLMDPSKRNKIGELLGKSSTRDELEKHILAQNYVTNPADAKLAADHIINGLKGLYQGGKARINVSNIPGASGYGSGTGGGTTTVNQTTVNNNTNNNTVYNNINTKINNQIDVKNALSTHGGAAYGNLSSAEKDQIEQVVKNATRRAIGARIRNAGNGPVDLNDIATRNQVTQEIKNSLSQLKNAAPAAQQMKFDVLDRQMSINDGYAKVADQMVKEINKP